MFLLYKYLSTCTYIPVVCGILFFASAMLASLSFVNMFKNITDVCGGSECMASFNQNVCDTKYVCVYVCMYVFAHATYSESDGIGESNTWVFARKVSEKPLRRSVGKSGFAFISKHEMFTWRSNIVVGIIGSSRISHRGWIEIAIKNIFRYYDKPRSTRLSFTVASDYYIIPRLIYFAIKLFLLLTTRLWYGKDYLN